MSGYHVQPAVLALLIVAGSFPIARAIWANRGTSLLHALIWTLVAWLTWGIAFLSDDAEVASTSPARYCALCLTGCAGVAVLGARRPHVLAWNFVVLCLFGVMVWPMFETQVLGTRSFDGLRVFFVAGTLAVGIVNYLPTRLGPPGFLLLLIGAWNVLRLHAPTAIDSGYSPFFDLQLTFLPWICWGYWIWCGSSARSNPEQWEFDRVWLNFRDSWGLVWSQRVREQFNHAAEHAGWPVRLTWGGLRQVQDTPTLGPADQEKMVATLRSVLQRFGAADQR